MIALAADGARPMIADALRIAVPVRVWSSERRCMGQGRKERCCLVHFAWVASSASCQLMSSVAHASFACPVALLLCHRPALGRARAAGDCVSLESCVCFPGDHFVKQRSCECAPG